MSIAYAWVLVMYLNGATTLPMANQDACIKAMSEIYKGRLSAYCINPNTGEVIKPK